MLNKLLLACFLPILYGVSAQAQGDCVKTYDREALYLRTEFLRGTVFVKNGNVRPVGFAFGRLKPEFENTSSAYPLFHKAQRNSKIAFVVGLVGLATAAIGATYAFRAIDDQGYLNERQYEQGVKWMVGSLVLSTAITIPLTTHARRQLDDAVWLHNREVLGR